jgi:hypothetical protein
MIQSANPDHFFRKRRKSMCYFNVLTETLADFSTYIVDTVFKMLLTLLLIRSFIKSRTAVPDRLHQMADY